MENCWLVVGSERNWEFAFQANNIWGLKASRGLNCFWEMVQPGDGLLFYISKPVQGVVGFGTVNVKFKQTEPLWPDEVKARKLLYPLRFEFDIEHCLPPTLWKANRYISEFLEIFRRTLFLPVPTLEVNSARAALGLQPVNRVASGVVPYKLPSDISKVPEHRQAKAWIAEAGQLQGYIAEEEYRLNGTRLDVVWRRVQRSVPTFVFEVQIGGDIYHAMAKLKHAFDLWNSHIFLVAPLREKKKYEELLAGTFHEVAGQMRFIDVTVVGELLKKKKDYHELERSLGIIRK